MNIPDTAYQAAINKAYDTEHAVNVRNLGAIVKEAIKAAAPILMAQAYEEGALAPDWSAPNPYK